MPGTLRLILGDQLSFDLSSLADVDPESDVVLMAEVADEATYVRHHKKKIAFLFSAMRHHARALESRGMRVRYVRLDDPANTQALRSETARAIAAEHCSAVVVTEPGEWRLLHDMQGWAEAFGVPVTIRDDTRFFISRADFGQWAAGRRQLRMEYFYREMRERTGLLMNGPGDPAGGQWNYDAENRKPLPGTLTVPDRPAFPPDAVTQVVIALVESRFADHFGDLEPWEFAVTQDAAEQALSFFLSTCLPTFGDYQDAMAAREPFLFHAVISMYLNAGLLDARGVCRRAEEEWRAGRVPLNAAEGFIRQILGWREYVRGVYWHAGPDYAARNALDARRPLPWFYWSGKTDMRCMAEAIGQTRRHAYAHHIQRLMVTGNFALIAGIDPAAVNEWYMVVYADAYEWVELPNTHGMALYADGGLLASKPYAASGAYINRMSDYCGRCAYDVKAKSGPKACPFNYLYWNFLLENAGLLRRNPRMAMPYRNLDRMDAARHAEIRSDSRRFLKEIGCA